LLARACPPHNRAARFLFISSILGIMRIFSTVFASILISLSSTAAMADKGNSCHFHGSKVAAEATVIGCADSRRDALVKSGKLHASWSAIKHDKIEQIDGKKGKEWKLSYNNPSSPEKDKQALYMFYTAPGNFIAANHTGQ
jgi:Family of unknown function (DUF6488)